jgi:hypothetical protein
MEREASYIKVLKRCNPEFVEKLLNLLGNPSSIEIFFRSKEAEEVIKKIASFSGIRETQVNEIKLHGKVSKDVALRFYKQVYNDEKFLEESPSSFRIREPLIILENMRWEKFGEYKVEFDGYSIQAEFASENELAKEIFELSKHFEVQFSIKYKE